MWQRPLYYAIGHHISAFCRNVTVQKTDFWIFTDSLQPMFKWVKRFTSSALGSGNFLLIMICRHIGAFGAEGVLGQLYLSALGNVRVQEGCFNSLHRKCKKHQHQRDDHHKQTSHRCHSNGESISR